MVAEQTKFAPSRTLVGNAKAQTNKRGPVMSYDLIESMLIQLGEQMPERLSRGSIPVVGHHAGHLDDLEILGLDPAELGERVGVPASIVCATDEVIAAVVGKDHSVGL